MSRYEWVFQAGCSSVLRNVGIDDDGTLYNPNGYPEDVVRAAVEAADIRCHERRSQAALKAAETRKRRQEQKVWQIAGRILAGSNIGNRKNCAICGRGLGDPDSIERGIGSECWQAVLTTIERRRAADRNAA